MAGARPRIGGPSTRFGVASHPRRDNSSRPATKEPHVGSHHHQRHRRPGQRLVRHPHGPVRDRPAGPAGRRRRRRLPGRRHDAAVGHHRRQAPQGAVRLLPAHHRRRRADVRGRAHPRLLLPPRGPSLRGRHPDLPVDRPPAAPDLHQRTAQRGPGRHHRHGPEPGRPVRRAGHQRRVRVHPDLRPAVLRSGRRCPRRPDRRAVGRLPAALRAGAGRVRHGRRGPARRGRRRDHDGRGRSNTWPPSPWSPAAPPRRPRRSSPRAWRRPSPSCACCARRRTNWPASPPSRSPNSRSSRLTSRTRTTPSPGWPGTSWARR